MSAATVRSVLVLGALLCATLQAAESDRIVLQLDPQLGERTAAADGSGPLYARARRIGGHAGSDLELEGDAEVRRPPTVVRADRITYTAESDELHARGGVRVVRSGNVFAGPELRLRIDANEGVFDSPTFELPLYRGRGRAERIEFLGPTRMALRQAVYSTCSPQDPAWEIRAEKITIDETTQEGSGESAGLYFGDSRVLAAPVFGFPMGDQRRSGFLPPTFALTSRTGADVSAPYYFNVAPNRDLTLYPRLMMRQGLQLGGQVRDLETWGFHDSRFEFTPQDTATHSQRYFWSVLQTFNNVGGWSGTLNMRRVSDDNYFVDYSRSILASAERVLPRDFVATRPFGDWNFLVRANRYQSILDARLSPPYERLPQLAATYLKRSEGGLELESNFDTTWFRSPVAGATEGARLVVNPKLSLPIVHPAWFVIPKLGLHATAYRLDNGTTTPQTDTLTRVLPTVSLDSGLVFERPTHLFGRDVSQTLEPRFYYVRTPYRDQSRFPVFDTSVADFNFAQLFADNTFVGNDRVADTNQLTTAVVTRLVEPGNGAETLRAAFGQRIYFSNQNVTIPGSSLRTDARSDLLLAAGATVVPGISLDGGLQYSLRDSSIPRINLMSRYLPGDGRIFNVGVRYLRDELGQFDTSWRWPIAPRWTALGRVNYSWLRKAIDPATLSLTEVKPGIIEGVAGFEFNEDCWGARFVMQRFVTAAGRSTTAFFMQLELTGLGRLGSDPFDILRRNIPGYRLPSDRPVSPSRFYGYE